jgi:hypothetical protein
VAAIGDDGVIHPAIPTPNPRDYSDVFAGQNVIGKKYEWSTPGIKHENGNEQMILKLFYFPFGTPYCWAENQCASDVDELVFDLGGGWWNTPQKPTDFPELADDRVCGTSTAPSYCTPGWGLNPDYTYRIVAKLPESFDFGFSIGAGKSGSVTIEKNSAGEKMMTIRAKPADRSWKWWRYTDTVKPSWDGKADDTRNILNAYFHGIKSSNVQWLKDCDYGRGMSFWANGDVVQYPTWNLTERTIQVQVGSQQLKTNGEVNKGTFEVAVPIKIAQCLWGVDLSKTLSATISAVYPELGTSEIITTSSRVANGIYYLTANGFHYSSPLIKVKMTNQVSSTLPDKTSTAQSKKISTIKCSKGKYIKQVKGTDPKCPAGYKLIK